jgi:tetratricopeptide (TPR) repeat protein
MRIDAFACRRALLLALALAPVVAALPAQAQNRGYSLPVAVAPVRADPAVEPLASGVGLWLRTRLTDVGLDPVWSGESAAPEAVLTGAAERGIAHALLPRLRARDDEAEVQLLLYVPTSRKLLAASRASASVGEIGKACAQSFDALLAQLGRAGSHTSTPPLLDELASTSRALAARADGELYQAWRAVQGKLSPTAMLLREQIVAEARRGDAAPAERARVLTASGNSDAAWGLIGTQARHALTEPRADPALLVAAGNVQLARNNPREAHRYFARARELAGTSASAAPAHLGLARALTLQSDADGARAALLDAARLAPADPQPHELLARLDAEDPARAAGHLIAAAQRSARRLDPQRAREHYERALKLDPTRTGEARVGIGALDASLGRPEQALDAYLEAVAAGAESPAVRVDMGRAQRALGDEAAAEDSFEKALELDATHPAALSELGALYTDTSRAGDALPLLERARNLDPHDAELRRRHAQALGAVGRPQDAVDALTLDAQSAAPADLQLGASLSMTLGDADGAQKMLTQAIHLDPGDPALREDLARVFEAQGDAASAESERLFAQQLGGVSGHALEGELFGIPGGVTLDEFITTFAVQVPSPERRLVAQLGIRRTWSVSSVLEWLQQTLQLGKLSEEGAGAIDAQIDQLYDFGTDASLDARAIATVNQVLSVEAVFVSKLTRVPANDEGARCESGAYVLESRILMGRHADVAAILANTDCLEANLEAYGTWNYAALSLYALVLLAIAMPAIRGWGTIHVSIRLPERTKGFMSIYVTEKPDQVRREKVDKKTGRERLVSARRFDFLKRYGRHMAGRETPFRWIPARKSEYTVTVGGPLLDAQGREIIGHFMEERQIRVRRGRVVKLEFDFRPKECAVEVHIECDRSPAPGGRAAVWGDPGSLRYARDGVAYLYLGLGSYTIAMGTRDSAASIPLDVKSLDSAIPLQMDFADDYAVVFRDCPGAVEPYLQGDLASAVQALERDGHEREAHHLRGLLLEQQGRSEEAASEMEAAGLIEDAAQLRATGSDFQGSAALFEQAGDHEQAAEAYRAANRFADAARCYEAVYDYHNALECWREVGDVERETDLLEKLGDYVEAGTLAMQQGDFDRAISDLQQIDHRHASYGDACRMIGEMLVERGEFALAVAKYEEAIGSVGVESASADLLEGSARALERAGKLREAISTYEAIWRRDAHRDDIAERIEQLKRELEAGEAPLAATAAASAPPSESRYELMEEIGRGGMGVVYKARDKRLERVVALKRLPENLREHPRAVELFEREARAAARLNHANIVTLFDAGEENGSYFITMELLEGMPLNDILEHRGRLGPRDVARLGIQIAKGLQYAHDQKIVHRDIKTANLFFTKDQIVKIMDFGIAKSLEEVRRSATIVGGTPFYMAPEQAAGQPVDHRADLYAFGVTLFHLVTGRLPFPDGDVTYRHCHEPAPEAREIDMTVPEPLSNLIMDLMAKQPDERPASAADVGAALRSVLDTAKR